MYSALSCSSSGWEVTGFVTIKSHNPSKQYMKVIQQTLQQTSYIHIQVTENRLGTDVELCLCFILQASFPFTVHSLLALLWSAPTDEENM